MSAANKKKINLRSISLRKIKNKKTPKEIKIVAEGDSWFDYPFVNDVIDHLCKMGYAIHKESKLGDTLENMVYGTGFKKKGYKNKGEVNLKATKAAIRKYRPQFVLFSACGNDIVGEEMAFYLNHKRSGLPAIRTVVFDYMVKTYMKTTIGKFCKAVWGIDKNIHILMDGYDYAVPNGTSYLKVAGPWILPTMVAKAYGVKSQQKAIIKTLVDKFNTMLSSIDRENANFHHINLRGMFPKESQWHNEIHLRSAGYKTVAGEYHEKIIKILGHDPVK